MASAKKSRAALSPISRTTDVETYLEMKNSLLNIIEEAMSEKKKHVHRLMCISKIQPGHSGKSVGDHFDQVVKRLPGTEEVSGLLLIFPMHCCHILEGTMENVLEYLQNVRGCITTGEFLASKILTIAHNINSTLFQSWMYHELDIQATGIGDYETSEATENLVIDMVINITKIGLHLSKQPKLAYNSAVQAIHEKVPELLPPQDVLEYFLEKKDVALQDVHDFLKIYEEPYKVILSSECVWPMPDHLLPSFS